MALEQPLFARSNLLVMKSNGSWWLYIPRDVRYIMAREGFDASKQKLNVWITKVRVEGNRLLLLFEIER